MRISPVSRNYADALLQAAVENDKLDTVAESLQEFRKLVDESSELRLFLRSRKVSTAEKMKTLRDLFSDKLDEYILNLLASLLKNKREDLINEVAEAFGQAVQEHKNVAPVTAYTAIEMSEDMRNTITDSLKTHLGKDIELTEKVDESLIGGIRLWINNTVYDGSISHQLEQLHKKL
ncbi:MAG: ATP synthase F1 subunit delta [Candidatus Marinimicrobia bacterium]|nr:ATP synthase F1 subunit delta [Candidatus Neomarinimicrobiota bacterium]